MIPVYRFQIWRDNRGWSFAPYMATADHILSRQGRIVDGTRQEVSERDVDSSGRYDPLP